MTTTKLPLVGWLKSFKLNWTELKTKKKTSSLRRFHLAVLKCAFVYDRIWSSWGDLLCVCLWQSLIVTKALIVSFKHRATHGSTDCSRDGSRLFQTLETGVSRTDPVMFPCLASVSNTQWLTVAGTDPVIVPVSHVSSTVCSRVVPVSHVCFKHRLF